MTDGTGTSFTPTTRPTAWRCTRTGRGHVTYSYDPDGDITDVAYPGGDIVTKAYDDMDRLSSLTDWLGAPPATPMMPTPTPPGPATPMG